MHLKLLQYPKNCYNDISITLKNEDSNGIQIIFKI